MIGQKKTALRLTRAQRGYPSNEPPQTFGESEMKDFTPHINPNRACNVAAVGGILHPFGAFTECRRGNLLHIGERIAAPHRGVFLFGLSFVRCALDGGNAQAAPAGCFQYGSFQLARRRLPRGKGSRFSKTYRNRNHEHIF